ncbi:MAG: lysylphosphatidylglycerol synthase transmembrane domain-containing protein [Calditrichota bacterium]
MKKLILNSIRIIISLGLLFYLLYIADIRKIFQALQSLDGSSIFLAVAVFIFSVLLMAVRWQFLTRSYGMQVKYGHLTVFYFIGFFFNNFLPTSIGGDLGRAYYLSQKSGDRSASIGTVFLERLIGLLATLSFAIVSLYWLTNYFHTRRIVYITIALFIASVMSKRLYRRFNGLLSLLTFYDLGDKITKVFDTLHYYRDKKGILLTTYIFSLFAQFMLIIMNYILARALNLNDISFGYLCLVVPITFVIGLLPSINGLGVRDSGYMLLLLRRGLQPAQILSLSFSVTIIPIIVSFVGGAFFLFYRQKGLRTPELKEGNVI